ncbi:MAG: agmatinase [Bacteriovoracaceae bacterium]|nr:agmatinase [Bacteriovoracaceae bacterium]
MKNYLDLPPKFSSKENSKIVVVPVSYDGTSTWLKGADKGPGALISASGNLELYDIETGSEVYLQGIFTDEPILENTTPEAMVASVNKKLQVYLEDGKFCVTLGGEHSISIGAIAAHSKKYLDLTVLQLDAHADLRDTYQGSKNNHACVMKRAKELVGCVQVGVRSMDKAELLSMDKSKTFFAWDIVGKSNWHDLCLSKLSTNVYLTIDLDVFDPSIMSSTGTPEPGGLLFYETLTFIKKVAKQKNIVGFDVVELCPNQHNKAPDFLAAKLVYKILSYIFL